MDAPDFKRRLDDYRLSLIRETFSKTRFSQIEVRIDEENSEIYSCSDPDHILGTLLIWEDPETNYFILLRDDTFYNHVDLDLIDKAGMTIDKFCAARYKSLEDLVNNVSKILLCLLSL